MSPSSEGEGEGLEGRGWESHKRRIFVSPSSEGEGEGLEGRGWESHKRRIYRVSQF